MYPCLIIVNILSIHTSILVNIYILNMPINVFGNSSSTYDNNKIDTSLFVQKPYLRTNYMESNIEENINMKNQFKIKNLPYPEENSDAVCKSYVDNKFNDPSIIKNTEHIDLNDRNITNARFIQVNQLRQIDSHLTAKLYVDIAISDGVNESSLLRLDPDENLEQDSVILDSTLTSPKTIIELPTKSYVDSSHEENERSRRDLGETSTLVRFNQTFQNYLKVSVGNDTYNLTEYNKISITDITEIKFPNTGNALLQKWKIYCNNKNNQSRINDFIKSTRTNSPTGFSGAMTLPPIGNSFMYIETSSNNHGDNVFVSWERTDIIQISNITFYYNRFSILTKDNLKNMGRFRIQLLLDDNTWSTQYTIDKNTQNSDSESDWKILTLDFTVENYGIKLIYDQIETAHSDMCFSNITITHSVY